MFEQIKALIHFIRVEALSGFVLVCAAIAALILQNSGFSQHYNALLALPLYPFINDYGMALFFLVVGLEIKREVLRGELSSRDTALLPTVCALGGMIVPAGIYYFIARNTPEMLHGWAIPTATDIAFSLGVLSLFGAAVPAGLKVFLTALAIIDDLLAILVIAFFYTAELHGEYLLSSAGLFVVLCIFNRMKIQNVIPYIVVGSFMTYLVHHAGIHATVAGVVTALTIPLESGERLEHTLHPWIAYGILPLFGFLNAGITLGDLSLDSFFSPIALGSLLGLFIGKQLGVFAVGIASIKSGFARLPEGVTTGQFYGLSILTGIGFTMSLFIGTLSFSDPTHLALVKAGVLTGSLLSAIFGAFVLFSCSVKK